ncbi:hypothetical protein KH263_19775 (plasmid) [Bacillus velezensis]|uniref:Uncharacterized protein n=1 Tax=Bacillus siamensis TaxID=659243 RepID=A0AAI8HSQ2_9BACI|nr:MULTISPECIES: hypothetical protein [Bacillus amyloliquefaciens group]AUJ79461.1 hypothetical protein CWD84_22030 [Bacillus siamensis]QVL41474.1 hypothetical protein KH263_19775 [Bacillus velezensis]
MAKNRLYHNMRALVMNPETGTFSAQKVKQIAGDSLETDNDLLPLEDAQKFINEEDGQVFYMYNLDLPAKVESEKLKQLRRSTALMNIFNYDKPKGLDLFKLMPWVVIIILAIFR